MNKVGGYHWSMPVQFLENKLGGYYWSMPVCICFPADELLVGLTYSMFFSVFIQYVYAVCICFLGDELWVEPDVQCDV